MFAQNKHIHNKFVIISRFGKLNQQLTPCLSTNTCTHLLCKSTRYPQLHSLTLNSEGGVKLKITDLQDLLNSSGGNVSLVSMVPSLYTKSSVLSSLNVPHNPANSECSIHD